jgi:hypothetical protein
MTRCRLPERIGAVLDYMLPTDIVDVQVERGGTCAKPELDIAVHRRTPLLAYCILLVSLLAASTYDISLLLLVRANANFIALCPPVWCISGGSRSRSGQMFSAVMHVRKPAACIDLAVR